MWKEKASLLEELPSHTAKARYLQYPCQFRLKIIANLDGPRTFDVLASATRENLKYASIPLI